MRLWIVEAELVDGLFKAGFAADLGFHRVEHAFYRLFVQGTTTSAGEFGQRLVIHQRPKRQQLVSRDKRVLMRLGTSVT